MLICGDAESAGVSFPSVAKMIFKDTFCVDSVARIIFATTQFTSKQTFKQTKKMPICGHVESTRVSYPEKNHLP